MQEELISWQIVHLNSLLCQEGIPIIITQPQRSSVVRFFPTLECRNVYINGNSQILVKFVYQRLKLRLFTGLCCCARMKLDCMWKNFFLIPSLRQNQICTMDNSSCFLHFKAMFSAIVKARRKRVCLVLVGKQQKCHQ